MNADATPRAYEPLRAPRGAQPVAIRPPITPRATLRPTDRPRGERIYGASFSTRRLAPPRPSIGCAQGTQAAAAHAGEARRNRCRLPEGRLAQGRRGRARVRADRRKTGARVRRNGPADPLRVREGV